MKMSIPGTMVAKQAKFSIGQIVRHNQLGYRGVIVDADPLFGSTDELYEAVAANDPPPKDEPWYHLLVDAGEVQAYVPEQDLQNDWAGEPINHPYLDVFFSGFDNDHYVSRQAVN